MQQSGTGTTTLTGTNTYTGGTTISAGTLQIGNGGTTGSIAGNVTDNGTLAFNRSDSFTFANVISGTGAVQQSGTGTTILTGTNTYTGGTTINGGTLQIGNGGTSGSIAGNVTANSGGTLAFDRSDSITFANVISGTGSVQQSGTGTTTLTGTNTYSGGTTISGGTLQVGNGGTTGSITGNVTDNGTLAVNRSDTWTLRGAISGSGAVQKSGAGTLALTGTNTYTGGTTVSAGTLSISSDANLGSGGTLALEANTALAFTAGGTYSHSITIAGDPTFDVSTGLTVTQSGVIADGGVPGDVVKTGGGTLILSATNTYTGTTTVNAGTLSVNGAIASSTVTVNSGGILGGNGTVGPTTIASGGALAPGNSIGTITVGGNLTFNAGSSYNVEVSPSAADRTNVTGSATLAGTVNTSYATGTYTAKRYTIINAAGGVSGTFGTLTTTNLPSSVNASLSYDANNVYLDLALNFDPPSTGLNVNQGNVADALTGYFNSTGGIPTVFANLSANDLSQVAGEAGAAVQQMVFTGAGLFMNSVFDNAFGNVNDNDAGSMGQDGGALGYAPRPMLSPETQEAYAAVTPRVLATEFEKRWDVWAAAYGGTASVSGNSAVGTHDTTSQVYGVAAGADYRVSADTRLGFALGGAGSSFSLAAGFGSGSADVFNVALYGRRAFGASYVAAALGYTWQDASTDRTVTASGTDVLRASFQPQALTARLEGGHRFDTGIFGVTPYAGLQSTAFFMPSYSERAASGSNQFALTYDSPNVTAARGELGLRFDKHMALADKMLTLKAKAAWALDWNRDRSATATFQQLAGTSFTVNAAESASDTALVSLGAALALGRGWSIGANFDGEFSRTTESYTGKGGLRWVW